MHVAYADAKDAAWFPSLREARFTMHIDGNPVLVRMSYDFLQSLRPNEKISDELDATKERWQEIENHLDGVLWRQRESDGSILLRASDVKRGRAPRG